MNDEAVEKMMELRLALVTAARTFSDYMRQNDSAQLAVAVPLDDARTEWVALGRPETICRMMSVG